jgi:hypothetical protein
MRPLLRLDMMVISSEATALNFTLDIGEELRSVSPYLGGLATEALPGLESMQSTRRPNSLKEWSIK